MTEIRHESGLVWWPDRGMGFYPAFADGPYDQAYWDKYADYAKTPMGHELTARRIGLVEKHARRRPMLDVGIGAGQFIEARNAYLGCKETCGYDVNPVAVRWLKERNLWVDPYADCVHVASCFDSLEHMKDPARFVGRIYEVLFVSIPIFRDMEHCLASRHFRKDEHWWHFTSWGLLGWMRDQGFRLEGQNSMEVEEGREDVGTFVFRRR